jgi:hypothetical protein
VKWWLGPVRFELARLTPMAGPNEDEVVVPVPANEWEHDVAKMAHDLDEGWEPPPLLVSQHDGAFFLEDGNHRRASLLRAGETHAWVILVFESEVDRDRFVEQEEGDDHRLAAPDRPPVVSPDGAT